MAPNNAPFTQPSSPGHLAVLVHGLWGNPAHLKFVSDSLREKFAEDELHILVAKRNAGSFTYDGIELGGERVTREIEEKLEELAANGHIIKRISVIGYSLGGLIARYAIGLLYHKGVFQRLEPMNFTTFATPHLGVRTPLKGTTNYIWNGLGSRVLSMSGRQLFMVDHFRDTGRPLLAVMADPDGIFIRALASFKNKSLYANAVNDRTVTYYTAGISRCDPFVDMDAIECNYVPGFEEVIMDGENPVFLKEPESPPAVTQRLGHTVRTILGRIPLTAFLVFFIPIGITGFLMNSAIQSFRSSQRIRLHETGKAGIDVAEYRIPLINEVRQEVEDMYETMNGANEQEYLTDGNEELAHSSPFTLARTISKSDAVEESVKGKKPDFPTLALTSDQFAMIEALDNVGFQKFPVYIHKHRHSHAAIIYRRSGPSFDEGKVVIRHWLSTFEL